MEIAVLGPEHWDAVARIYAEGIATGNATFETEVPSWEAWDAGHLAELRLVALDGGEVVGWAALSPVSGPLRLRRRRRGLRLRRRVGARPRRRPRAAWRS